MLADYAVGTIKHVPEKRLELATHEAAHAVICRATGGVVDVISLGDDQVKHGYVRARYERNRRGQMSAALVHLAGYAGEWFRATGGDVEAVKTSLRYGVELRADGEDFTKYGDHVESFKVSRYAKQKITSDAIDQVTVLVQRHWPAIEFLAAQVAGYERVSGELLQELLAEAMAMPKVAA